VNINFPNFKGEKNMNILEKKECCGGCENCSCGKEYKKENHKCKCENKEKDALDKVIDLNLG
jgi:hypothetical protein